MGSDWLQDLKPFLLKLIGKATALNPDTRSQPMPTSSGQVKLQDFKTQGCSLGLLFASAHKAGKGGVDSEGFMLSG